jgi:hypothetical protein
MRLWMSGSVVKKTVGIEFFFFELKCYFDK